MATERRFNDVFFYYHTVSSAYPRIPTEYPLLLEQAERTDNVLHGDFSITCAWSVSGKRV